MPNSFANFKTQLIDKIAVPTPNGTLSYADYVAQPKEMRDGDEHDFVDARFTNLLIGWLGYEVHNFKYNATASTGNIPDYRVFTDAGAVAFVIEDKASNIKFDPVKHGEQLRRYAAGTSGYAIWTNGCRILGLRFNPQGAYSTLVDIDVIGQFGLTPSLFSQQTSIEYLYDLFNTQRFNTIGSRIKNITTNETDWESQARAVTDKASLESFLADSRGVLNLLQTAATSRLASALSIVAESHQHYSEIQAFYRSSTADLMARFQPLLGTVIAADLPAKLLPLEYEVENLNRPLLDSWQPPTLGPAERRAWVTWRDANIAHAVDLRARSLNGSNEQRIADAYRVWTEKYKIIEDEISSDIARENARRTAYSEQVAYVFFVRLLLARVLEDKGVMPRLISDGGFGDWYDFLERHFYQKKLGMHSTENELFPNVLTELLYLSVIKFYQHFYNQPVFDWFEVDDYLLAVTLEHLNSYNFKGIASDLIGYTYETFIDRTARNRKGHFLTKPDIIEYMLEQADYQGKQLIGSKLLDPACGSGSFLVGAARRLRAAIVQSYATPNDPLASKHEVEVARDFVNYAQSQLYGMEINPFSCYLAELNLFIQVLDDLIFLWKQGEFVELRAFNISNSNSLELPHSVLYAEDGQTAAMTPQERDEEDILLGEGAEIKRLAGQFTYVIGNPPYVNRGIISSAPSYAGIPFYKNILSGDSNTYLLFLQLATYYCANEGIICYIIPLNLFGDKSSQRAREIFANGNWTIKNLTRFYKRTVLFEGVLQGVCVVCFSKQIQSGDYKLEIRGGDNVAEATQATNRIAITKAQLNSHLQSRRSSWYKGWAVTTPYEAYDVWEHIRNVTTTDVEEIINGKFEAGQGDLNATYAKPLQAPAGVGRIPVTKGDMLTDFGGWQPAAYLDYKAGAIGTSKYSAATLENARKKVERVANLDQTEVVIFLKEVSGLEMKRPIRGTVVERDKTRPVVGDHTLLRVYPKETAYNDRAYALFGLLTSAVSNYIFGLFSTNPHVSIAEVLRTPTPTWNSTIETKLAIQAQTALKAGRELDELRRKYAAVNATNKVSVNKLLTLSGLPTMTLEQAVKSGRLTAPLHPERRIKTLAVAELVPEGTFSSNNAYKEVIQNLLSEDERAYNKAAPVVLLPFPADATTLQNQIKAANTQLNTLQTELTVAIKAIDATVYDWYKITNPLWRTLIEQGMAWSD